MPRLVFACVLLLRLPSVLQAAQSTANYLSLQQGYEWELVSGSQRMTLDVTGRNGEEWIVQWKNPFIDAQFHFVLRGEQVLLAGLDMGTGLAHMPGNTVYFDFGAKQGATWTNALGTIRVVARGHSISTPSGTYPNAIEFELVAKDKARTYWTFAPGIGFVQFGQGRGAFQLASTSRASNRVTSVEKPPPGAPAPPPVVLPTDRAPAGKQGNSLLVGLDANPTATEGYDNRSKQNRMTMAIQSGVTFQYLHPKWNEVEPRAGTYKFDDVDFQTSLGADNNLPIAINLRIIDTNTRATPEAYSSWKWDDPRMADKLKAAIRALAPHLKGRVRWVAIGNEVDNYFSSRRNEIGSYATLIATVIPVVHELFPNAGFSINFTYAAAKDLRAMYSPLTGFLDYYSFTYYPLNGDFSFRDPSTAAPDVADLVRAAGDRLVLFQEIGYASSTVIRSSEDQQARFLENVFAALRQNRPRIIGANFVWMSDLPDSVVDDLTRYYRMGNAVSFKAFLATLGYWDGNGKPKKAWSVFTREAPTLK